MTSRSNLLNSQQSCPPSILLPAQQTAQQGAQADHERQGQGARTPGGAPRWAGHGAGTCPWRRSHLNAPPACQLSRDAKGIGAALQLNLQSS